jgi:hypothetical protein
MICEFADRGGDLDAAIGEAVEETSAGPFRKSTVEYFEKYCFRCEVRAPVQDIGRYKRTSQEE